MLGHSTRINGCCQRLLTSGDKGRKNMIRSTVAGVGEMWAIPVIVAAQVCVQNVVEKLYREVVLIR